MILNRIELADILGPIRMAQAVHAQLPFAEGPVPVLQIASALGIEAMRVQPFDGFEGMLLTDNRRSMGAILANNTHGKRRARFTIGHELGHFLLERHLLTNGDGFQCRAADMREVDPSAEGQHRRQEAEANQFAAELLAPRHLMRRMLNGDPDLESVLEAAMALDISFEVCVRRMVDLSDARLAAVWSYNGNVRYSLRSKGFPFITCGARNPLPTGSCAARHIASGCRGSSGFAQAPSASWVNDPNHDVLEQTRLGKDGHAVTLLRVSEPPELDEDDGGLDELTAPRFR